MPACSICSHPARAAIDAGIVTGAPLRGLARTHRVSLSALRRHRDAGHLPKVTVDGAKEAETVRAVDLLKQLGQYERTAASIAEDALQHGEPDPKLALAALDRALAAVVAQSRMLPSPSSSQEVRVILNVPRRSAIPPVIVDEADLPGNGAAPR